MRSVLVAALALCACTDDPRKDILDQLAALPDVTVTEWTPPADFTAEPGYRFFDLTFTQPIDHDNPSAGTFVQHGYLMHADPDAPLVFYTSGYGAGAAARCRSPQRSSPRTSCRSSIGSTPSRERTMSTGPS